jgi:WG containing repeat
VFLLFIVFLIQTNIKSNLCFNFTSNIKTIRAFVANYFHSQITTNHKMRSFILTILFLSIGFFLDAQSNGIVFKQAKKYGLKTAQGKILIPAIYKEIFPFSDGLALVRIDKKYGFININNQIAIPAVYDYVLAFRDGSAPVKQNKKWGYIDTKGKIMIPLQYEFAYAFSEGLAGVKKQGKYYFINTQNKIILGPYQNVQSFSEGYAGFQQNNLFGYIDKNGVVKIVPQYTMVFPFEGGKASVQKGGVKMKIGK